MRKNFHREAAHIRCVCGERGKPAYFSFVQCFGLKKQLCVSFIMLVRKNFSEGTADIRCACGERVRPTYFAFVQDIGVKRLLCVSLIFFGAK